ncbi:MAG TPA: amino acid adenylation domain-containing protein, partial [Mycobacteriales bacterium]|nr:amino acid adenylation domain-containing protein [Mycobacteriales bacterium]
HLKVLSQLTPDRSFRSGLVSHGRPEVADADRVYGMYLNTLPFRYDRGAGTWRELVRQVHAQETALWPHRRFPAPEIQREFGAGRRLIEIYFSFQDFQQFETDAVEVTGQLGDSANEFPFSVAALPGRLSLRTDTHALNRSDAERLAAMYRAVLAAIASDVDGDATASFLPPGERELLLTSWNGTATPTPAGTTLDLFEAQAARSPDATAAECGSDRRSYAELDQRANQIGQHLRGLGVGPEDLVAVLLDRGPELLAALLGAWKAGAAYLPIDPSWPAQRVARIIADAGVGVVLTEPGYADRFPSGGPPIVHPADTRTGPTGPVNVRSDVDQLAYVIYTSGSTGAPKGVQVPHRGLANHLAWARRQLAGRGTGGGAVFSSVAFDLVVPNLWAPLLCGQRVWFLPPAADLAQLGRHLLAAGPFSFLKLTPGHLEVLTSEVDPARMAELAEVIVVAGEPLPSRLAERWRGRLGSGRLINEYGPTEASVGTCVQPVDQPVGTDIVPIGAPLPNMTMNVLDGAGQPVPVGVTGELYVGGAGVARGYLGAPAATAAKFVPDPYGPPGARLYRTGDLARWRPEGTVEFVGRIDDQVKIRGYRIELGEVAAAVTDHPAVRDAVVVAAGPAGQARLIAYCVPAGGELPDLTGHCAARLPDYMVPSRFVPLPALPLTANGKLDRRALPDPDGVDPRGAAREHIAAHTPTERALAEIWARVLNLPRVSVSDDFFQLGGHSILVIQVIAAAQQAGVPVSLWMLYEHPTIAGLAAAVDAATPPAPQPAEPPRPAASAAPAQPSRPAQPAEPSRPAQPAEPARSVEPAEPARSAGPAGPAAGSRKSTVDGGVAAQLLATMAEQHVPGASVAIIRGGELVSTQGYGVRRAGGTDPVTPETLFQAGSISKHVTTLAVLRLAGAGDLDLDEDIHHYLTSWHVPSGPIPAGPGSSGITIRHLLGHRSGLTPVASPTEGDLLDLLHGRPPVGTPPVTGDVAPGAAFRKANVHFSVLEQLLQDLTGSPFPELARELVLEPLGMSGSSFDQRFPRTSGRPVALGHDGAGTVLPGGWKPRVERAAAGLWTTAPDLARVAIEIRSAYLGRQPTLLDPALARLMLTADPTSMYGLGAVVDGTGAGLEYGHAGEPTGYRALTMSRLADGLGIVVLTNGEAGKQVLTQIVNAVRAAAPSTRDSQE